MRIFKVEINLIFLIFPEKYIKLGGGRKINNKMVLGSLGFGFIIRTILIKEG